MRTRSLAGCSTCRKRHVKCDETRPTCRTCKRLKLQCGYAKHVYFDFEHDADSLAGSFRRPLFTEAERKCMSQELNSSLRSKSAEWHLSRIDEACEVFDANQTLEFQGGPFGVFHARQGNHNPNLEPAEEAECSNWQAQGEIQLAGESAVMAQSPSSPTSKLLHSIFAERSMSFPHDWQSFDFEAVFDDASMDFMSIRHLDSQAPLLTNSLINIPAPSPSTDSFLASSSNSIPQDAVFLLKHYSTAVIRLLTPIRHHKTPWHILFVPEVKHCLAALTLGEHPSHAHLCTFYGTLAVSAFSLGGPFDSSGWFAEAIAYKERARIHSNAMLRTAYNVPKMMKYKSVLMALITMIQVCTFSGDRDQIEHYFLQAEKLIRLKGLDRRKSRKVRLLHHCYVFERMFYESTYVQKIDSMQRQRLIKDVESSGIFARGQDSASFRLVPWKDLDQEMLRVKSQEEGENDLFLERPGVFSATMYPEIFGVPESWILLLSMIIRLGREREAAEENNEAVHLGDYMVRAKALERRIRQLRQEQDMNTSLYDYAWASRMLDVMHHAMLIYFYRRVYDVSPLLVQKEVSNVLECLSYCGHGENGFTAGFLWAVAVAAGEAEGVENQTVFTNWLSAAAQHTGLPSLTSMMTTLDNIWQRKLVSKGFSLSWLDSMKIQA